MNLQERQKNQHFTFIRILGLGLAYALIGYASLPLAVTPGYISAIFPSAGIAIAALLIWGNHLWPGVFLGSALLNTYVGLQQDSYTLSYLGAALITAAGASSQALVASWLVRRHVKLPIALAHENEIFWFMLLAGPIACIINATFAVTSLYITNIITLSDFVFSWFTWWIGDVIGVLITAPLLFIAFAQPRQLWAGRKAIVTIPLLFMLTSVITLFFWASKLELERTQFDFKEISLHTHERLRSSFASYFDSVASIERLYLSSTFVSREEFSIFVASDLAKKTGMNGLSWNPIITDDQRDTFEKKMVAEGINSFKITERNKNSQLIEASQRNEYVVVNYIEPLKTNRKALGFDCRIKPKSPSSAS
jgi:integral membrane sensor domain MASE1